LDAIKSSRRRTFTVCPSCGEGYPKADGDICLGCQGKAPYLSYATTVLQKTDTTTLVTKRL